MDDLIGKRLVAVERLAWSDRTGSADPRTGPAHLHFDGGSGVFPSGATDRTLEVVVTRAGDESWLVPYQYDIDGALDSARRFSRTPVRSRVGCNFSVTAVTSDDVTARVVVVEGGARCRCCQS